MRISTFQVFWYWTDCNLIKIVYLCTRKSAGIDFTLNANTIKREKEVVHSLHDLASLYTVSILHQIIAEKFGKVIGGGTFVGLKYREKMKKKNVTKIDASYVAPTVDVIEMASEGCLCGSFDRTESNDPDDYGYGGRL